MPRNREDLVSMFGRLREEGSLLDSDEQAMLEGVLQISELTVKDVMIPNAEVTKLDAGDSLDEIVEVVAAQGHSRYPVFEGEKVVGVLLAKDLLRYTSDGKPFRICKSMRPPVFAPMSKRLDVLLREFRDSKNHMVIVVDEYDAHAGLVTIEDVLERIVGNISDEYDEEEENIFEIESGKKWRVKGLTTLEEFDRHFGSFLEAEGVETIGGQVASRFGTVPQKGEVVREGSLQLRVLASDSRRVLDIEVQRLEDPQPSASEKG